VRRRQAISLREPGRPRPEKRGAALDYLLDRPDAARALGQQGLAYVDREYRWPVVMEEIERVLAQTG
jgi:glycosyltransferase involved in cell wall biosynthesis